MDLDSPFWTTKIWTSVQNYGLHQMALPVKVHILEPERSTNGHTKLWTFPEKYGLYPNST
jgi:hypothetical protein